MSGSASRANGRELVIQLPGILAVIAVLASCVGGARQEAGWIEVGGSKDHLERASVVEGKVSFTRMDRRVVAMVRPVGRNVVAIDWPTRSAVDFREIDGSRNYRLEFLDARLKLGGGDEWEQATLLRVLDGERVLFDRSICEVHGTRMVRQVEEVVPVSGRISGEFRDGYRPRKCPNDGMVFLPAEGGIRHLNWRCADCREASVKWMRRRGVW